MSKGFWLCWSGSHPQLDGGSVVRYAWLHWAICASSEAGVLRFLTRPKTGEMSMEQVTAMLGRLKQQPGYHYQPIAADWQALSEPFFRRLHGHNQ